MNYDDRILVALYNAAVANNAYGGYRLSQLMPEGSTLQDARAAAARLLSKGYIEMPQGMAAGPMVYITDEGCRKAQSLINE